MRPRVREIASGPDAYNARAPTGPARVLNQHRLEISPVDQAAACIGEVLPPRSQPGIAQDDNGAIQENVGEGGTIQKSDWFGGQDVVEGLFSEHLIAHEVTDYDTQLAMHSHAIVEHVGNAVLHRFHDECLKHEVVELLVEYAKPSFFMGEECVRWGFTAFWFEDGTT